MERWCKQWNQARGAIISLEQQWQLARAWCKDRRKPNWRRYTPEETLAIFKALGLTSEFWDLA